MTETTTCDCYFCSEYEDTKCEACGTMITPSHEVIRVHDAADVDADLCRSCIGAGFSDQVSRLIAPIAAKQAAIAEADRAYVTARDAANEAFWAATAEQAKAYDAAVSAARQAYKDAAGEYYLRHGGLRHPDSGPWNPREPAF